MRPVGVVLLVLTGCVTVEAPPVKQPKKHCSIMGDLPRPTWASVTTTWILGDGIYAVGLMSGVKNHARARSAAINRARAEALRRLELVVQDTRGTTRHRHWRFTQQYADGRLMGSMVRCLWWDGDSEWAALVEVK